MQHRLSNTPVFVIDVDIETVSNPWITVCIYVIIYHEEMEVNGMNFEDATA